MDVILNDGTVASNVTVEEYEKLRMKGYVGNFSTSNGLSDLGSRCWKCGKSLTFENISDRVYLSNPPKYTCKECEHQESHC